MDSPSPTPKPRHPRRRMTAALMAIVLGGVGAHKFYLGQNLWGLVYLMFAGSGIPFIVGVIDGVMLLNMSDERFDEVYNRPTLLDRKHPKAVAASLAFFLGGFGAHKFYLRQTIAGLIYLAGMLFGTYLSFRAMEDAGIIESLAHLSSAEAMRLLSGLDRMNIEGMALPYLLILIPSIGGMLDGLVILCTPRDKFEREYGLTPKE